MKIYTSKVSQKGLKDVDFTVGSQYCVIRIFACVGQFNDRQDIGVDLSTNLLTIIALVISKIDFY